MSIAFSVADKNEKPLNGKNVSYCTEIKQDDVPAFELLPQRVASEDNGDNCVDIDYCVSLLSMMGLSKMAIIVMLLPKYYIHCSSIS